MCSTAQITARVIGTVLDETGAVISGATISIRHMATNRERQTLTNDSGRCHIAALDVGAYHVTVHALGFKTQVLESLPLEVGRTAVQDFVLSIGELADQMIVTATAGASDRATLTTGYRIDRPTNADAAIAKRLRCGPTNLELSAEVFNLFNQANFGQPGGVVGSPNFGRITNTRFPVGDVGSSRQIQLSASVQF